MPEAAKVLLADKSLLGLHLRNHLRNERDAFEEAYARIARLLDIYSLVCGHAPKLLPIVVRAHDGEAKATVATFDFSGTAWAEVDSKDPKDWQKRNDTILELLLPAMDVALKSGRRSDLGEQLLIGLKMFAQGCRAHDRQIQFLCKFTALEGLVCGHHRYKKEILLKTRLKQLLRGRVSMRTVARLWNLRCSASHQGRGSWFEFVRGIDELDRLVIAAATFAAGQLATVKTVEDMWSLAPTHKISKLVLLKKTNRFAIRDIGSKLGWLSVSHLPFDWKRTDYEGSEEPTS